MSDRGLNPDLPGHAAALLAAQQSVAVYDRSHWGRIQLLGSDRQIFLHNQSTNDFKTLKPGQGADTLFVTATARTLDLATAYVLDDAVLVIVSPNRRTFIMEWLDRYIFFGDNVTLKDCTEQTAMVSLIGPESSTLLNHLGIEIPPHPPYASHQTVTIAGHAVRLAVGSGLALPGYTLIGDASGAAEWIQALIQAGAVPMGDRTWEHLRILQGRPLPDQELTEDYNAVEACLWQAISIDKGCYIGQETIARLDTYKGVKQQIWGLQLSAAVAPGAPITLDGEKIGVLTSATSGSDQGSIGLGYVRTKAGGAGLNVQVGETVSATNADADPGETILGKLIEVPFLQRDRS